MNHSRTPEEFQVELARERALLCEEPSPAVSVRAPSTVHWIKVESRGLPWQPEEPGDSLIARFAGEATGLDYRALRLAGLDGRSWYTNHTQLIALLELAGLRMGDLVRATYLGTKPTGRGNPMKLYMLEVEARTPPA